MVRREGHIPRRTTDEQESATFLRLAAQLGLSRQLHSVDMQGATLDVDGEQGVIDEDQEDEDDAPLTPLRSDSSLSSELSLPRSFGKYSKAPFDAHLTQRNHASNAATSNHTNNDMMRKFYEAQVEKIRSQLALVTQSNHALELRLQQQQLLADQKRTELEAVISTQKTNQMNETQVLTTELQQLRTQLEMEKAHFLPDRLPISDAHAAQLSRQDPMDLSIKEVVQLYLYQTTKALENQIQTLRTDLAAAQAKSASYEEQVNKASKENAQVSRSAQATAGRLQQQLELSEASRMELEQQVTRLSQQLKSLQEQQDKRSGKATSDPTEIWQAKEQLENKLITSESEFKLLSTQHAELQTLNSQLQQQIVLLQADKSYFQENKQRAEANEQRLQAQIQSLQNRLDLAMASQQCERTQAKQHEDDNRAVLEQHFESEVAKMMELSRREIESIRNTSQIVYERENRLLKQARDDALEEVTKLQTRVQSMQLTMEEKNLEMNKMETLHTTIESNLRNELKMKHFELNQLGRTLDERAMEARSITLELGMVREKLEIHQQEFAKLETTSTTRITQLEAALETERTKWKEYEQLELDLDEAVLQTGAIASEGGGQDVMATFSAIPTTSKRRFHQSVQLAQQVVKYQRESMKLTQELKTTNEEKERIERELEQVQHRLAHLQQPQSYLIDKLTRKDQEIQTARQQNQQLEQQLQELRTQYQSVNQAKIMLQSQLQQVLARREELDGLKGAVWTLRNKLAQQKSSERNQLSPALLKQMTKPPTPTHPKLQNEPIEAPPKWYIKLRS